MENKKDEALDREVVSGPDEVSFWRNSPFEIDASAPLVNVVKAFSTLASLSRREETPTVVMPKVSVLQQG